MKILLTAYNINTKKDSDRMQSVKYTLKQNALRFGNITAGGLIHQTLFHISHLFSKAQIYSARIKNSFMKVRLHMRSIYMCV